MKKPVGDIAAEIRVRSIFFIEENYSKLRVSFDTMISRYVSDYTSVAVLPRLPDMGSSFERYRSDESFALKGVHAQAMLNEMFPLGSEEHITRSGFERGIIQFGCLHFNQNLSRLRAFK
ncbi:MAG: hypothetical protein COB66_09575, partial [Coxiella sp. (in: Bacteria)]